MTVCPAHHVLCPTCWVWVREAGEELRGLRAGAHHGIGQGVDAEIVVVEL
jgi:hypothetical protein